jgi:hypothetical protein
MRKNKKAITIIENSNTMNNYHENKIINQENNLITENEFLEEEVTQTNIDNVIDHNDNIVINEKEENGFKFKVLKRSQPENKSEMSNSPITSISNSAKKKNQKDPHK